MRTQTSSATDPSVQEAHGSAPAAPAREDELYGVSIDTTSICNLRCTTCSLEDWYDVKGVMSQETFERVLGAVPRLRHLALSVNAEPLLHPGLVDMVRAAKRVSRGAVVTSFTTNATLLDEARTRALIAAGLDALEVSLDGTSKATYEAIRTGARWERVIENVARIAPLKRAFGSSTPALSIRYTLFEDNRRDVERLLDLAHSLGIDQVVINGLEPYDERLAGKLLYAEKARPQTVELFDRLEARASALGMRLDLPLPTPEPVDDCRLIDHSCIVLWNGDVAPCSPLGYRRDFFAVGRRETHPQVLFGNVHQRSLHEIWDAPQYLQWRAQLRAGEVFEYCKTCLKRAGVICPLKHWRWLAEPSAAQSTSTPSRHE